MECEAEVVLPSNSRLRWSGLPSNVIKSAMEKKVASSGRGDEQHD